MSIPKIIHYCWFGGNPLGPKELKCIDSWRQFFPKYKIVQWNESNFDVRCCTYVSQAFDSKMWAFVSDYARFAILYKYGGLYFDTDVEVIRPMDDIIAKGPFMGFEADISNSSSSCSVAPGLGLSANSGLGLYKLILDSYETDEFLKADGTLNKTTVVTRTTDILRSRGLMDAPGIQEVAGITIYPSDYFNPKDFLTGELRITENTRSIHHFGMSWHSKQEAFEYRIASWCARNGLSTKSAYRLARVAEMIRYADFKRVQPFIAKLIAKGKK